MNLAGRFHLKSRFLQVLILALAFFTVLVGFGYKKSILAVEGSSSLLERLNNTDSGVVESGRLIYINDGDKLGNESYRIKKREGGGLELSSEGVVTPPIPIPFIKPRIKFNQTISLDNNLAPASLSLQYKGPLGIGSKKITAFVDGKVLEIKRGKEEKNLQIQGENFFFTGTTSSGALLAIMLARKGVIPRLTEIRSGGTGPRGGDEDKVLAEVVFQKSEDKLLKVNGRETAVTSYTYREEETGRRRELIINDGSLVAYRAMADDRSFYAYREDLLGEGFRF